jgi:hypothetical protein
MNSIVSQICEKVATRFNLDQKEIKSKVGTIVISNGDYLNPIDSYFENILENPNISIRLVSASDKPKRIIKKVSKFPKDPVKVEKEDEEVVKEVKEEPKEEVIKIMPKPKAKKIIKKVAELPIVIKTIDTPIDMSASIEVLEKPPEAPQRNVKRRIIKNDPTTEFIIEPIESTGLYENFESYEEEVLVETKMIDGIKYNVDESGFVYNDEKTDIIGKLSDIDGKTTIMFLADNLQVES